MGKEKIILKYTVSSVVLFVYLWTFEKESYYVAQADLEISLPTLTPK